MTGPQTYPQKVRDLQGAIQVAFPVSTSLQPTDPAYKYAKLMASMSDLLVAMAASYAACDAELQRIKNPRANTPTV